MGDVVCVAEGASEVGADVTATALAPARIGAVPGEPHHANHAPFANGTARLRRATTRDGFISVERSLTENALTGDNGRLNASTCCLVLAPKRAVKEWALQDLVTRRDSASFWLFRASRPLERSGEYPGLVGFA